MNNLMENKIMTHGDIYIPYVTKNGTVKYLYCEAWSDGYFDGVGYAMLASSSHMDDVIKLNTIFFGSPFYYDSNSNELESKEGDYLEVNTNDQKFNKAFIEAFELFKKRDLEALYNSEFAKISIEKKIKMGIASNAELMSLSKVLGGSKIISDINESMQYIEKICEEEGDDFKNYSFSTVSYIYYENQWYAGLYDSDDKYTYVPLILGVLNFTEYNNNPEFIRSGCLADPFTYIEQNITEKDLNTLKELYQYNLEHNFDMSDKGWVYVKEYVEKMLLEEKINPSKTNETKHKI